MSPKKGRKQEPSGQRAGDRAPQENPLPNCPCHADYLLSADQANALRRLKAFADREGTQNLSTRLIWGDTDTQRIYNSISHHIGRAFGDRGGLSALGFACHLVGIEYRPGCRRDTTYNDDLDALIDLYDAGEQLHDAALVIRPEIRSLFHRLKKRASRGGSRPASWFEVVADVYELRADVDLRRFFAHAVSGIVPDVDGRLVVRRELRNKPDEEVRYLRGLIMQRDREGLPIFPQALRNDGELGKLVHRLGARIKPLSKFVARAVGRPIDEVAPKRTGAKIHGVVEHCSSLAAGVEDTHPYL